MNTTETVVIRTLSGFERRWVCLGVVSERGPDHWRLEVIAGDDLIELPACERVLLWVDGRRGEAVWQSPTHFAGVTPLEAVHSTLGHGPSATAATVLAKPLLRGWLHAVSFIAVGVLGLFLLAFTDASHARRLTVVIYLLGTLTMFGASALYHRGRWTERQTRVWRRVDHSTIFLAIAGAYTPIAVAGLDGWQRTATLLIAWGGTLIGVALQWIPLAIPRPVFAVVYLLVGWSVAPFLLRLFDGLGALGFSLLLAGGLAYTAGAVVYSLKRPDPWPTVFGYHEVFHLLTVVGAGLHFAAIALVAVPKL
jgi:hemolysin III